MDGVYLESTVIELKPNVLEFLSAIINKAKEVKDYVITMKKKDMADLVGKDVRTVTRYLNNLQKNNVIEYKGQRGRGGTTLVKFNTDLIKFNNPDNALITTDDTETIDKLMQERVIDKNKKPPKKKKRNRRTKQQILEDKLLQSKKEKEIDRLNSKLKDNIYPDWEWFQETEDPVGNYRTYLISRLYNRYAVLFTENYGEENMPYITNDYDVLPKEFYGTSRWNQFGKFRKFCEENGIDPATYLSAQFSRTIFTAASKGSGVKVKAKHVLPFVNSLTSDASYEVYKQYCEYQKKRSQAYATSKIIPPQFAGDYVVSLIRDGYRKVEEPGKGLLELKASIDDFLSGEGSEREEEALAEFYKLTSKNLRKEGVSLKTRDTIKKYLMLQSLILSGGSRRVPKSIILGSEMTRAVLQYISEQVEDRDLAKRVKARVLGALVHPHLPKQEQMLKGAQYLYQTTVLNETPFLVNLIMKQLNLYLSIRDINEAFKEYGRDKIPVDEYSMLDIDRVVEFVEENIYKGEKEEPEEINHEDITMKRGYILEGTVVEDDDPIVSLLEEFLEEKEGKQ